jgi:hypothetical protein
LPHETKPSHPGFVVSLDIENAWPFPSLEWTGAVPAGSKIRLGGSNRMKKVSVVQTTVCGSGRPCAVEKLEAHVRVRATEGYRNSWIAAFFPCG